MITRYSILDANNIFIFTLKANSLYGMSLVFCIENIRILYYILLSRQLSLSFLKGNYKGNTEADVYIKNTIHECNTLLILRSSCMLISISNNNTPNARMPIVHFELISIMQSIYIQTKSTVFIV